MRPFAAAKGKATGHKIKNGGAVGPKTKNGQKPRGKIKNMCGRIRAPKLKKGKNPRPRRFVGSKICVSTTC